jgi:hypothetical protein
VPARPRQHVGSQSPRRRRCRVERDRLFDLHQRIRPAIRRREQPSASQREAGNVLVRTDPVEQGQRRLDDRIVRRPDEPGEMVGKPNEQSDVLHACVHEGLDRRQQVVTRTRGRRCRDPDEPRLTVVGNQFRHLGCGGDGRGVITRGPARRRARSRLRDLEGADHRVRRAVQGFDARGIE